VDQGTTQCALGLRTQPSKPTGQSPYFLVYDSKAIFPADVMWDSPVVWTSLGPLLQWVPGPTTRWAARTARLVLHGT
jgi:hypothetical protein